MIIGLDYFVVEEVKCMSGGPASSPLFRLVFRLFKHRIRTSIYQKAIRHQSQDFSPSLAFFSLNILEPNALLF
jgi:hypothetical protein